MTAGVIGRDRIPCGHRPRNHPPPSPTNTHTHHKHLQNQQQDLTAQRLRLGHILPYRLSRWCEEGAVPYLQAWGLLPTEVHLVCSECLTSLTDFHAHISTQTFTGTHTHLHTNTLPRTAPSPPPAAAGPPLLLPHHRSAAPHPARHAPQQRPACCWFGARAGMCACVNGAFYVGCLHWTSDVCLHNRVTPHIHTYMLSNADTTQRPPHGVRAPARHGLPPPHFHSLRIGTILLLLLVR